MFRKINFISVQVEYIIEVHFLAYLHLDGIDANERELK